MIPQEFNVKRTPYSEETLNSLRTEHNSTHSFFRHEDWIYISPMLEDVEIGDYVRLETSKNPDVVLGLIRHIFFRKFRASFNDREVQSFYPFRFFSSNQKDDIVHDFLDSDLQRRLARKKMIEIQFRKIDQGDEVVFGATINIKYKWLFDISCDELIKEGYNLIGTEVLERETLEGLEDIIAPDESLVGTVLDINEDGTALLETNEGTKKYQLVDLYLHKSTSNIDQYLSFKYGEEKKETIIENMKRKDYSRRNAKHYKEEIDKIVALLSKIEFINKDRFYFKINSASHTFTNSYEIEDPSLIFDQLPGKGHKFATYGLKEYGPYDSNIFERKSLQILVICTSQNRGVFTSFLAKLQNGAPNWNNFNGGMQKKYSLHEINFHTIETDSINSDLYLKAAKEYIEQNGTPDFVIAETSEQVKRWETRQNPYYTLKAYLLSMSITSQFVKTENLRNDYSLQYVCDSIALQIYAKLGGIPWLLPASTSIDHEIIVGIGSSIQRNNHFASNEKSRIVGITTFFSGDGKYLLGNTFQDVPYEEYFDELLKKLRQAINHLSDEYGWTDNDVVRIVFHVFKPIKNVEAEVVEELIAEYPQFDIKFSFITISEFHPFILFDTQEFGSKGKGEFVPKRGTNLKIDDYTCLLQLKGPKDIKSVAHGFSHPIQIKIHDHSTFTDLFYIVKQVYYFTNLSWKGFFTTHQPVTILYSQDIVRKLTQLKKIDYWNPEIVNTKMKKEKWFL